MSSHHDHSSDFPVVRLNNLGLEISQPMKGVEPKLPMGYPRTEVKIDGRDIFTITNHRLHCADVRSICRTATFNFQ